MAGYKTSDFRKGLKVQIDGEPYLMTEMHFVKPGKGNALYKCKLRNLLRGTMLDRTYKGGDSLEAADVEEIDDFQGDAQGLTSIERLDLFTVKRAIWQAAHDNGDVYILWRYAFIRNCIFSERMTFAEFGRRYQKRPNSLYFLRDRLMRDARKILGLDDD